MKNFEFTKNVNYLLTILIKKDIMNILKRDSNFNYHRCADILKNPKHL